MEPHLEPLSGEQLHYRTAIRDDHAHLDVAANEVWGGQFERTFFDIRVFNPFASSNQSSSISATYIRHEKAKKRSYEERLREIEHASLPRWSSRQPVAWTSNLPRFTSVLHHSLLRKAANRIRLLWHSSVAALGLLCSEQVSCGWLVTALFSLCMHLSLLAVHAPVSSRCACTCLFSLCMHLSLLAVHAPVSSSASLVAAKAGTSRHL